MAPRTLRDYIDLIEGRGDPWGVDFLPPFLEALDSYKSVYPDIKERVARFLEVKQPDPLSMRYGKNDRPMAANAPMAGFQHCHLAPDLILLYTLKGRKLNLVSLCQHVDIEGKRQHKTAKRLAAYRG